MLDNIETLGYIVSNLFRVYVMYLFMDAYFKGSRRCSNKYILLGCFGYFSINTVAYLLIQDNIFINVITNIIPFFCVTFLYNSSILRKIVGTIVPYIASLCIDAFLMSIQNIIGKEQIIISSGISTSLLIFLTERLFEYLIDKHEIYPELKRTQLLLILFVPLASLALATQTMDSKDVNYIIESIVILGINIIVFYIYDMLLKAGYEKYKLTVLEEQNKSYESQLKIYQESAQKDSIIRHDMKNHLFKIKEYVNNRDINGLKEYTDDMISSVEHQNIFCNTGNSEIDSILNFKCTHLKQLGAEIHFDLNIPDKINVESFDLTKILGNLLDNVLDAIEKAPKKIVYIRIYFEKGVINICVKNTFNGNVNVAGGYINTIKADIKNHGLGLKSIREAVEKYDGEVDFGYSNSVFSVYVILYEK